MLGFNGDQDGAYTDLNVNCAVAGLGGFFLGVDAALSQFFGKPDVQYGLAGSGGQCDAFDTFGCLSLLTSCQW